MDTRICDACGRKYEYTHANDRCPVCVPKDAPEEVFENHELVDELPDDN